jgi:predicted MFS family arabinose efflux permease
MSWMGDYLPHEGLSEFWGRRHQWQQWSAAAALATSALVIFQCGLRPMTSFSLIILAGAVLGVIDVFLFTFVEEPPVKRSPELNLWRVLRTPFAHPSYRTFIRFTCFWHFAAMIGAPFISMYLLEHVGLSLFGVLLLWSASWAGGAVFARGMGRLAETYGQRPVLVLCTAFKPLNMLALLFSPREPTLAFCVLVPVFMIDAVLNAGINIGSSGFMLKHSPRENRTMFVAAGTALAGLIGGVTAIAAGLSLKYLGTWSLHYAGYTFVGFHVLFGLSLAFRLLGVHLARALVEPESTPTRVMLRRLFWRAATALEAEPEPVIQSLAPEQRKAA